MGHWVGVDYGRKRIGLAVCDARVRLASPAGVVAGSGNPQAAAAAVHRWAQAWEPIGYVVGLPLNMDDSVGPQARLTQAFLAALASLSGLPVHAADERLSSFQADLLLSDRELTREQRARQRDALAAAVILQTFLNAQSPPAAPRDPSEDAGGGPEGASH